MTNSQPTGSPHLPMTPNNPAKRSTTTLTPSKRLPAGVYVASNVFSSAGRPAFAETVADPHERNGQWARIKSAGADQRLCRTFRTETAYYEWFHAIAQFFNCNTATS